MRFHQPLDLVEGSPAKVRVLRFLCRKGGEWTGRRIAAELGMNPVTTHRALRELHEATVLDFRKGGNNFFYSLRDGHYLVRKLLRPLFEAESRAGSRLLELLMGMLPAPLKKRVVSVAVYGSVARGEERPTSDIDLLVLVDSEQVKQKVLKALAGLPEVVEEEFGNSIALYLNTAREGLQKSRLPLFQNILLHHDLLWGSPLEEVLRDRAA